MGVNVGMAGGVMGRNSIVGEGWVTVNSVDCIVIPVDGNGNGNMWKTEKY